MFGCPNCKKQEHIVLMGMSQDSGCLVVNCRCDYCKKSGNFFTRRYRYKNKKITKQRIRHKPRKLRKIDEAPFLDGHSFGVEAGHQYLQGKR